MKTLTKIGLGLSVLWLLLFAGMVIRDLETASGMTLNELGDFLAGATAPLALFWLVIGYFQHGEELRLNTKALHAQEEELRRQVEQATSLSLNAARQAEATESLVLLNEEAQKRETLRVAQEAQLQLIEAGGQTSGNIFTTRLLNRGGEVKNIELQYSGAHGLRFLPNRRLESNGKAELTFAQGTEPLRYPIRFRIGYTDKFENRQLKEFELSENHQIDEVQIEDTV